MDKDTMTDELIRSLSLYKGGTHYKTEDNSGDLFSDMEEVLEDDKSEYLHNTYRFLIKQAMVKKDTERLRAYGEWVKGIQNDFATWEQEEDETI